MDFEALREQAYAAGFDRVYTRLPAYAPRKAIHRLNDAVADDPREILPATQTVIVLVRAYQPFRQAAENGRGAMISAYYAVSHMAYKGAKQVADWIKEQGFQAVSNAQIAIKPMLVQSGIGWQGRNSLISISGLGSRFHVQVILTDAEMGEHGFETLTNTDMCVHCRACMNACPTHSISEDGRVNIDTCLRARGEGEVVPVEIRHLYQNRILGCEICQNVCPRNRAGGEIDMPEELRETLALKTLLRGDLGRLSEAIGKNYARKTRIRMKAALVAGNLKREDCLEELRALAETGADGEKEYANWAIKQIEEDNQ